MFLLRSFPVLCFVFLSGLTLLNAQGPQPGRPKVALVLSGGGARGAAHIGVLMELEEAGVPIDFVVGASYGSLVGGLYAAGYSPQDLADIVTQLDWNQLLDDYPDRRLLNFSNKRRADRRLLELQLQRLEVELPSGLQAGQKITQLLDRLSAVLLLEAGNDFDRLRIPFRAVATDLLTGKLHIFRQGALSTALRASMAVPGIFTPVEFSDTLLIDGGVVDNLPVRTAIDWGADIIIAVDISTPLRRTKDQIRSVIDVLDQTLGLHIEESTKASRQLADVLIQPDLEDFTSLDFASAEDLIPLGRRGASEKLSDITKLLGDKGISLPHRPPSPSLLPAQGIDPGCWVYSPSPLAVESVSVSGANHYPPSTVLKHSRIRSGQEAGIGEMDRDVSAIYGSDLFDAAGFRLGQGSSGNRLTFQVDESARSKLGLGLRYDKDYQFTGAFEVTSRQLGGSPFDLISRALVGNVKQLHVALESGSASGRRFFANTSLGYRSFDRLIFSGTEQRADFQDRRLSWGIGVNRLIGNTGRLEAGYLIERVDIERGSQAFVQSSAETLAGLSAAFGWDSFDRADFPGRGLKARLQIDWRDRALGSDYSFVRLSAGLEQRLRLGKRGWLGVGGSWRVIEGGAPFYELLYSGSQHYFEFVSDRFIGLRRDERVSKQRLILDLSYRHRLKSFQLGVLQHAYLEAVYNGGLFSKRPDTRELDNPLHGFGFGASFDIRFLGPVRVLLGKTDETDWTSYFSIGYEF